MRLTLAVLLMLASTGCLRSTTMIDLRPDGSGTIVQETGMSTQGLAMLQGMAGGAQAGGSPVEMFSEAQARKAAETMNVTFVSGEPFKTAAVEGYRARFSFDDISKVKVNMDQSTGGAMGNSAKQPPFGFALDRGAASSVLTIDMPEPPGGGNALPGLGAGAGASDADKAKATQALMMMKMMMQGLFVDVSMNVNGRILKTNAPNVDGSHITLLQIDLDKLFADPAAMEKLQSATDIKSLAGIPGLKIATDPKVTIEFAR